MNGSAADEIKARLTMRQVAGRYGYEPNRSGFLRCPFHSRDRTASLKIYPDDRGWYCFGCHRGGGPVEFVMELYRVNRQDAIARLNMDFDLRLKLHRGKVSLKEQDRLEREARRKRQEIERERERQRREELREIRLTWEHQHCWEMYQNPGLFLQVPELYITAVKKLPFLEYQLDVIADTRSFVSSHDKTIPTYETISTIDIRDLCQVKEDPEMTQRFLKECAKSDGRTKDDRGADRQGEMGLHERRFSDWKEAL